MKHVEDRFGDRVPEEVLLLCLGITSGAGRLIFGRVADYIPGAKKVYLQVCLHTVLKEYTNSILKALVAGALFFLFLMLTNHVYYLLAVFSW